jgi:hypothetical protein
MAMHFGWPLPNDMGALTLISSMASGRTTRARCYSSSSMREGRRKTVGGTWAAGST